MGGILDTEGKGELFLIFLRRFPVYAGESFVHRVWGHMRDERSGVGARRTKTPATCDARRDSFPR